MTGQQARTSEPDTLGVGGHIYHKNARTSLAELFCLESASIRLSERALRCLVERYATAFSDPAGVTPGYHVHAASNTDERSSSTPLSVHILIRATADPLNPAYDYSVNFKNKRLIIATCRICTTGSAFSVPLLP
jgi:hypothetical protein